MVKATPFLLGEGIRPKLIRMFKSGCPGSSAETIGNIRPNGIGIKGGSNFFFEIGHKSDWGGSEDTESEKRIA